MCSCFPWCGSDAIDILLTHCKLQSRTFKITAWMQQVFPIRSDLFRDLPKEKIQPWSYRTRLRGRRYEQPARWIHARTRTYLAAGTDGLKLVRRILANAPDYLTDDGILIPWSRQLNGSHDGSVPRASIHWIEFLKRWSRCIQGLPWAASGLRRRVLYLQRLLGYFVSC